MIPHKLTLRNFMCYRDEVPPLQFDGLSVVCLSGENGAGKSTLLDAITWALWGRARAKSDDDLIALGQSDMEVDFEFVLDGILRRVIRRRTKGKRGQSIVEFQVCDENGAWRRISGDSVRDTDAQIAAALRMNYDTFINSAFLLQGRADEFTNRKPAERKQVLADILGLTEYERLEARAKERRSDCDAELHNLAGLIDEYTRQVQRRPFLVAEVGRTGERASALAHEVARSEEAVQGLRAESDRLRQIARERGALESLIGRHGAELREVQQETAAIEQVLETAEAMIGRRAEIEAGVARLQRLEARLEEYEHLRDEYQRLAEEQRVIDAALGAIRSGLERDRKLAGDRVASLTMQAGETRMLQAELARLDVEAGEYAALHDERDWLRAGQTELEDRQQQLADLQARKMRLEEPLKEIRSSLLAEQSQLVRSIQTLEQAAIRLPQIERELRDVRHQLLQTQNAEKQLTALRDDLQQAREERGRLKAECDTIEKQGKELVGKLKLVQEGTGECPVCAKELGPDGHARLVRDYEAQRDQLRSDLRTARAALDAANTKIAEYEPEVERLTQVVTGRTPIERRAAALEEKQQQLLADQERLREQQVTLDVVDRQLAEKDYGHAERALLQDVEAELAALGQPQALRRELEMLRKRIQGVEARLQGERDLHQRRAASEERLRVAMEAATQLPAAEAELQAIMRQLAEEAYGEAERAQAAAVAAALDSLGYTRADHDALRAEAAAHRDWTRQAIELERAEKAVLENRALLERKRSACAEREAELEHERAQLDAMDLQLRGRQRVESDLTCAEQRLTAARDQHAIAERDYGGAKADLERCNQVEEALEGYRAQHEALAEQRAIYEELVQAFGKKGIQAMLIETAIPELEHESNTMLARMTDNQMHLSFETQRDSKKGDTIETLDIRIADGLGTRDYSMFSGGEAFRVNFAVRVALSKLLAHRADANLKTLVIDEGFGTQDSNGRDRIVEAINAVSPDFERILVITHIQELKDLFPAQIEVTKGPDGSAWRLV